MISTSLTVQAPYDLYGQIDYFMKRRNMKCIQGMLKAAEHLKKASQAIVPVDKGDLHGTARVEKSGQGFGTQVFVSYGGTSPNGKDVDYAVYVHEDLLAHHAPGKEARYLEKPMIAEQPAMTAIIVKELGS